MNGDFGTSPLKKGVSQVAWPAYPPFSCLANSKECYPSNGFAGAPTRRQSFQDPHPSNSGALDINIVVDKYWRVSLQAYLRQPFRNLLHGRPRADLPGTGGASPSDHEVIA